MDAVSILAHWTNSDWFVVPVALLIIAVGIFCFAKLVGSVAGAAETEVRNVAGKVKETEWYKAREEKKEIERLQRQLIKKQLEDELKNR